MESLAQSTNMKRFVIQDTFTKVTTDGEPHEMMTMIAGLSGVLAAIIILTILVSLVACKKNKQQKESTASSLSICSSGASQVDTNGIDSKRSSVLSILRRDSKIIEDNGNLTDERPRLMSTISCISNGNLEGNLNSAFIGSELSLSGSVKKLNKQIVQENEIMHNSVIIRANDTIVNIDRY